MANLICPPSPGNGAGTFSDKLVGYQITDGTAQFTMGNFSVTNSTSSKQNREFEIGVFGGAITLENLDIKSLEEATFLTNNALKVFFNYNKTKITNFTLYGSLRERLRVAVQQILYNFPAALNVVNSQPGFIPTLTFSAYSYNQISDETTLEVPYTAILNPFNIEITKHGNLPNNNDNLSPLRNFSKEYKNYVLDYSGKTYQILEYEPIPYVTGVVNSAQPSVKIKVKGNPFEYWSTSIVNRKNFCEATLRNGILYPSLTSRPLLSSNCVTATTSSPCVDQCYPEFLIRPSDLKIDELYADHTRLGEIETYLINRSSVPEYKATFDVPAETPTGKRITAQKSVTWTKMDPWNIVISGESYSRYLTDLYELGDDFDSYKTNLVSRFLTTAALKEFDTADKRVEKTLQLYGREFDEVKKYIEGLAYMTKVDYTRLDNVPDKLLKNLAQTLGWGTPSSISKDSLLDAVFGGKRSNATKKESPTYQGTSINQTPTELDADLYRRLVINSAYLFKSKGTRKALEFIFNLVGAPEALIEFNEHVYVGAQKISMSQFNKRWSLISAGTYTEVVPVLSSTTYFDGVNTVQDFVTTAQTITSYNSFSRNQYPVNEEGYPTMSNGNYFQRGAGWFEETTSHRGAITLDVANSTFTGASPDVKTKINPFTYGQPYLDTLSKLPNMNFGFNLLKKVDNKKAWIKYDHAGSRRAYDLKARGTYYNAPEEPLVINVKNVDILMNVGQGLTWGVWDFSRKYGVRFDGTPLKNIGTGFTKSTYTLPGSPIAFTLPWPGYGGTDFTKVVLNATKQTFFEFADNFYKVLINVKNRQTIDDGKGGGYPTLKRVYLEYLKANHFYNKGKGPSNTVGSNIPDGKYRYGKMLDFVEEMGDYWIRLAEQFVPATTIWHGGTKIANSAFDRQKLVYKRNFCLSGGCDDSSFPSYVSLPAPVVPNKLIKEGYSGTTAPVVQTELQSVSRWISSFIGELTGNTTVGMTSTSMCGSGGSNFGQKIYDYDCACTDSSVFGSGYAPYTPTMNGAAGYPWENGSVDIEIIPQISLNLTTMSQYFYLNSLGWWTVPGLAMPVRPLTMYNHESFKLKLTYTGETLPLLSTGTHIDLDTTSLFAKKVQNMLQSNVYCDPNDSTKIAPCADNNLMSGSTLLLADYWGGRYQSSSPILFGTNPAFSWNTYSSSYVGGSPFMVELFGIPIPLQPTGSPHSNDEYILQGTILNNSGFNNIPCEDIFNGVTVQVNLAVVVKDRMYGSYNQDVGCSNLDPNGAYAPTLQTGFAFMSGSSLQSGWEDNDASHFTGGTNGSLVQNCEKQQLLPYFPQTVATVYDWSSNLPPQYKGSFSSGATNDSASTVSDCYDMMNLQKGPIFSNDRYGCFSINECKCKELSNANLILEGLRNIGNNRKTALLSPCCLGDNIILNLYWWQKEMTTPTIISFNINKTQFIRATVHDRQVGIDNLQLRIPEEALDQIIDNPYIGRSDFIENEIKSDIILNLTGNTVSGINLNINTGSNTSNGITQPSYWQNFLNTKDTLKGGKIRGNQIKNVIPNLTFGDTSNDAWDLDLYISCQNTQLEELSIKINDNDINYNEVDPILSPCLTNCVNSLPGLSNKTVYKKEKLSEITENSGKLTFDYKEFFKVNYPNRDIKDFKLVGSQMYNTVKTETLEIEDCNGKLNTNQQVIYNAPLNSGNTINSDFSYLLFKVNGEEQVRTSWLKSLRDLYYVDNTCDKAINIEFYCPEQRQDFEYSLQTKQVGSVEVDFVRRSGTTQSVTRKYENLDEWIKRGLGPTGFSNTVLYYGPDKKINKIKVGPEYRYSLESPYWTSIRNIEEEFIASQFGTAATQNYTGYTTGTTACAEYTFPAGYSAEVCCVKCASGSVILPSDPCYGYCISGCCSGDTVTYELGFAYSAFTGSTLIPFGERNPSAPKGYLADTLLDSDDSNMKSFIPAPVYNNNGGPLIYSAENPTKYVRYTPIKSNHFRFQYRGLLDVNYLDDGWKSYVQTNYLANTGQGYPLNDYQFKKLINKSIINKGGLSDKNTISEGVEANKYTATARLGKVTPYYGYSSGTGVQDFYFKTYIEIEYGSGGTKTLGEYTVGSNSYKYPSTNAHLTLPTNISETGLNDIYSTTFSGDTTFNRKFDVYVDTGDWYVTTGDTVLLKYETRWNTDSKSGTSQTKFTVKLGGDYSDPSLSRAPWYRVTKSIGEAYDTKNLIWNRCTTSSDYSWKTPEGINKTSNEVGTLFLVNSGYTPTHTEINSSTFNNQIFLDVPNESYVGNLEWQTSNQPTNLWSSAIQNYGTNLQPRVLDFSYQCENCVTFDSHNYTTTWNLPTCVSYSGSNCCSPQLPCVEHRYIQLNTFKSICDNTMLSHYVVYEPQLCDVSNCLEPETDIHNLYTIEKDPQGSGATIYFSGNEIIINNKPVNIKSATATGTQLIKSNVVAPDLNQVEYREQLKKAEKNRRQGKVIVSGLISGGIPILSQQIYEMGQQGKIKLNKKYKVSDIESQIVKMIAQLTDPTLTPDDKKKKRCKKCGETSGVGGCVLGGCLELTGFPPDGIKITWNF